MRSAPAPASRAGQADASYSPARGILVLDMSYTLDMINERQLGQALQARDVGGFFSHVVSVHPLAGLFEPGDRRYGPPVVTAVGDRHFFVEGRPGAAPCLRLLAPLNFLIAQIGLLRLLRRIAEENHVALVRVGDPYYLGLFGWALARSLRVPLAIRVPSRYDEIRKITGRATMPRLFRYGWIEKRIERFVFPRCDLIAGANEDNMRYALENGGRAEVATVFRYGNLIHPDHWTDPRERPDPANDLQALGLSEGAFVATVTRLEPMKRVDEFVRVVAGIPDRRIKGLIVGDGTLRPALTELARSLGAADRIVFAGNRTQAWIARVLPRAAVIVSPHMGRALVEAALSGVPIVAFDYDWQREVVVSGETGYLVADGAGEAMVRRTEELLDNRALARVMGANARAMIVRMMDPDALMRHEQASYEALLRRAAMREQSTLND